MMKKGLEDFKQYVEKRCTPEAIEIINECLSDYEKSFKPSQEKTPKVGKNEQTKECCGFPDTVVFTDHGEIVEKCLNCGTKL